MQKAIEMNNRDIEEIQASFSAAYPRKAALGDRFYLHLFRILPETKCLFAGDHSRQKEVFASMLTCCFQSMVIRDRPVHGCNALAGSHAGAEFGLRQEEGASKALMAALQDVMGNDLTETQSAIWQRAVMRVMRMVVAAD